MVPMVQDKLKQLIEARFKLCDEWHVSDKRAIEIEKILTGVKREEFQQLQVEVDEAQRVLWNLKIRIDRRLGNEKRSKRLAEHKKPQYIPMT